LALYREWNVGQYNTAATIKKSAFRSISFLQMDVVRELGRSLNGSEVEFGLRKVEMCNGMCHTVHQSGAALKAIVRRRSARSQK